MARSWKASERGLLSSSIDEIEHRRGLELAEIAGAVGDRAVAELERHPHRGVPVDRRLGERRRARRSTTNCARSSRRPRSRKRQPVPRVMFSWARPDRMATKRTISSSAASSGSRLPRARHQALAHLGHHRTGRRDHVDGEAVAHRAGQALDGVEHGDQAAVVGGDGAKALLEGGILRRRQRRGTVHQVGLAQQAAEQAQLDRIARAHGALGHLGGRGAQQPGIVVQALDVAAEPVEIVGDAALQVGAAALDGELVEAPGRGDLHVGRVLGQHPDVLQRAVQPAERAQAGIARRLARQPARQHAIAVAIGARRRRASPRPPAPGSRRPTWG